MFKNKLIELLEERNITAYKLAKDTGISQGLMGEYKNGIKNPTGKNLTKIAEYFNVSTDYLLGKTDDPSPASDEEYTEIEKDLVTNYRKLDDEGKIKLDGYLEDLVRLHNLNIQKINDKHKALTLDNTKIEESDIEFIEKLVELKEKE